MRQQRVTLAQIAEKSGKHITTVSMALRNSKRLSQDTRETIQHLAKEMGYKPDPHLKALVSYRNKSQKNYPTIAYVTNWNTRWGWQETYAHPEFFIGAQKAAEDLGFKIEHFWLREPGLTHNRLSSIFKTRAIEGVIVASHVREIDERLKLEWDDFSAVKIDYFPHTPRLHVITNNQIQISRLAMQEVLKAGYTRIGYVIDQGWDITVDNLYIAGFIWEQQKLPIEDRIHPYLIPNKEPLHDWIKRTNPQVIIGEKNSVFPALEKLNLKVPDDISFVDIFNLDTSGTIAGITQNHIRVGELAVEILSSQIQYNVKGIPKIPTTTHVDGVWVPGKSLPIIKQN
ncbi:MAG: LacI family DNA-binding transcriptional regulator [Opitutales bacterium]|nr:LacI family DNA-binding transcriptional regulator [Opitutales bacterium]